MQFFSFAGLGFIFGCAYFSLEAFMAGNKKSRNTADLKREAADLGRRQKNFLLVGKTVEII